MGSQQVEPATVDHYSSLRAIRRSPAYQAVVGAWSQPAVIACSGGVDSSALVLLAAIARRDARVGEFVACHVDHQSRPTSAQEAQVVRALCSQFGVPFIATETHSGDSEPGRSMEDVWRERRYAALSSVCRQLGVSVIVTAHTLDDQVETVLMRLFSGSRKLSMPARQRRSIGGLELSVVRPLLTVSRSEIVNVLDHTSLSPVEDSSNMDITFRRNAVRHRLVPEIGSTFAGFERALVRSASLSDLDGEYCDLQAEGLMRSCIEEEQGELHLSKQVLADQHPAIASRIVMLAAKRLMPGEDERELGHERVSAVLKAARGRSGATIELPGGVVAIIERDRIRFVKVSGGEGHG